MKRFLLLSALLLACDPEAPVERRSTLEHGRDLFASTTTSDSAINTFSCATCHRATQASDDRILPGASMLGVVERPTYWGGEPDLLRAINHCRYYFMSAQRPWTREDEQAKAMYVFLSSLPQDVTGAQPLTIVAQARDVPAGDAKAGENVYDRSCRSCHGAARSGKGILSPGYPRLPEDSVAAFEAYGFDKTQVRISFIEKVRHGGFVGLYGTMPPYSTEVMTDDQLGGVLAYLGLY